MFALAATWQQGSGFLRLQCPLLQQSLACLLLDSMVTQSPPWKNKMMAARAIAMILPPIMPSVYTVGNRELSMLQTRRGPSRIIRAPATLKAAPKTSHRSGWTPSTIHSQISDETM